MCEGEDHYLGKTCPSSLSMVSLKFFYTTPVLTCRAASIPIVFCAIHYWIVSCMPNVWVGSCSWQKFLLSWIVMYALKIWYWLLQSSPWFYVVTFRSCHLFPVFCGHNHSSLATQIIMWCYSWHLTSSALLNSSQMHCSCLQGTVQSFPPYRSSLIPSLLLYCPQP